MQTMAVIFFIGSIAMHKRKREERILGNLVVHDYEKSLIF